MIKIEKVNDLWIAKDHLGDTAIFKSEERALAVLDFQTIAEWRAKGDIVRFDLPSLEELKKELASIRQEKKENPYRRKARDGEDEIYQEN